jgi:hypothetical protein
MSVSAHARLGGRSVVAVALILAILDLSILAPGALAAGPALQPGTKPSTEKRLLSRGRPAIVWHLVGQVEDGYSVHAEVAVSHGRHVNWYLTTVAGARDWRNAASNHFENYPLASMSPPAFHGRPYPLIGAKWNTDGFGLENFKASMGKSNLAVVISASDDCLHESCFVTATVSIASVSDASAWMTPTLWRILRLTLFACIVAGAIAFVRLQRQTRYEQRHQALAADEEQAAQDDEVVVAGRPVVAVPVGGVVVQTMAQATAGSQQHHAQPVEFDDDFDTV